ncbi:response regulator transcription factor [Roseateles amylovorans]|uniref:Response regulator n=1 Tax=Roseateles amylovorans TaxID=2978473 RepID=A0ABY6AY81_9BURK|nr:response regulator [Roseateles amylovorans]UXH76263.1 response regulator [Roseateles amylovorans]
MSAPVTSATPSSAAASTGTLTCFLVEDSPLIRENLIATLQEMLNMEVVGQAEDEAGALRWLQDEAVPCDLVIIDLFLKRGTGLSLLPKARQLQPEAKLVVLSNYATVEMRHRCEQLGADRVFDKSSELDELIAYCLDLLPTEGGSTSGSSSSSSSSSPSSIVG